MISRRPLSERVGRWVFWLMFAGMHIAFLPMHLTGLMGMPRRVFTYLDGSAYEPLNLLSTIGAAILAVGILLFLIDVARNFRWAPAEGNAGNVFGAGSLEWLPSALYSTRSIPLVTSREPLWDQPDLAKQVEEGRYFLPNSATGLRETIVTSPVLAEPEYVEIIPGPSPWPLISAVFTAFFFLALTVQAYGFATFSGVVMLIAVLRWLWETDRPIRQTSADIGANIQRPTYRIGPSSHGWWALTILFVVFGVIMFMAAFGFLYLYGVHPQFWIAPPDLTTLAPIVALNSAAIGLAYLAGRSLRASAEPRRRIWIWILMAAVPLVTACWLDARTWIDAGLIPSASGQGATVFAIIAQQGTVVALAVIMCAYLVMRATRGLLVGPRDATLDAVMRVVRFTAIQGALVATLTRVVQP
jgi:cytochrome c oxidase subunit I+III